MDHLLQREEAFDASTGTKERGGMTHLAENLSGPEDLVV